MDYEVFLVSRMREDFVHGDTARQATINGMGHGARVVTAAALIMISVFSGFIFLDDPVIKSMGFALAIGVAIDAFVVRMTIVPAVMSLLNTKAWWLPRWLDRVVPNVDIEGEGLRTHLADSEPARV
jgi:RND superfamily putative drug exporter